jgi:hypothetical protein
MDVFRQVSLNDREFRFVRYFSQKPIGFRYASRWCGSVEPQIWSTEYIYKYIAYSSSLSPLDISFAIRNNSVQKCAKSSWTSFSMWDRNLYRTASNNEYNTVIIKPSYVPFSSPQNMATKSMAMILPKTRQHFVSRIPSQMGVPEIRGYTRNILIISVLI